MREPAAAAAEASSEAGTADPAAAVPPPAPVAACAAGRPVAACGGGGGVVGGGGGGGAWSRRRLMPRTVGCYFGARCRNARCRFSHGEDNSFVDVNTRWRRDSGASGAFGAGAWGGKAGAGAGTQWPLCHFGVHCRQPRCRCVPCPCGEGRGVPMRDVRHRPQRASAVSSGRVPRAPVTSGLCASRFIHPEQSGASSSASGSEPKRRFRRSTDPELARKELALLLDAAVSSGFVKLVDSASDAESSAEDACEPATADKTLVGETRS